MRRALVLPYKAKKLKIGRDTIPSSAVDFYERLHRAGSYFRGIGTLMYHLATAHGNEVFFKLTSPRLRIRNDVIMYRISRTAITYHL